MLTDNDFACAARLLGVEQAVLEAVAEVETASGGGFLKDGRVRILFEGHIFWRRLRLCGIDPEPLAARNPDILFCKRSTNHYRGGAAEWERLERAAALNRKAALESASWGAFQIMGFNHALCGETSVEEFVDRMGSSEAEQLRLAVTFMQKTGVVRYLKTKDWNNFARQYNGAGYAANSYDKRLAEAYRKKKR